MRACKRGRVRFVAPDEGRERAFPFDQFLRPSRIVDDRIDLSNVEVIDPQKSEHFGESIKFIASKNFATDMSDDEINTYATDPVHFGATLVGLGIADGMVAGRPQ